MLAEDYTELNDLSLAELARLWRSIGDDVILIGGWAAHFLVNERFRKWKGIDYIGSKDIDFAIREEDVDKFTKKLIIQGYTPLNFRFYKIFDRKTKKSIDSKAAASRPIYDLFYLYVDVVLDKVTEKEKRKYFFSDKLIDSCLRNKLWLEVNGYKVVRPEPILIIKTIIIGERNREKALKDLLDCLFISNFADVDFQMLRELLLVSSPSQKSIRLAKSLLNSKALESELGSLRLDRSEANTMKTAFLSLLELMERK